MSDESRAESPATPTPVPDGGERRNGEVALVCENLPAKTVDPLACTAVSKRGAPCGRRVGVKDYGEGPRCPAHKPRAKAGEEGPRAPVRVIRSHADALRLTSWAAVAVAERRISANACSAIAKCCQEWRQNFADAGLMDRARALVAAAERDALELRDLRIRVARAKDKGLDV